MKNFICRIMFSLVLACGGFAAQAATAQEFSVNNVFRSHMVLQRQKPIRISGKTSPGKSVAVTIGKNTANATAGEDGRWEAVLPAMEAGGPYQVIVEGAAGSKAVVLEDVLIGEVWLCSGQSNMAMPVSGGVCWQCVDHQKEVAEADYPQIRIFQQVNTVAPDKELDSVVSWDGWTVCSPKTISPFSACSYFFGRQLYKELNVPIGLINCSWSGTYIEPWISRQAFARANREELKIIDYYRSLNWDNIIRTPREEWRGMPGFLKKFWGHYAQETKAAENWKNPGLSIEGWQTVKLPGYSYKEQGVIWFRRDIELPAEWADKELTFNCGAINDYEEIFFNGELVAATKLDGAENKNPRSCKIPASLVKSGKNSIVIRNINVRDDGKIPEDPMVLKAAGEKEISIGGEWLMKKEFTADPRIVGLRPSVDRLLPATLYSGMVHPWTALTIRGFLWYQGCSNYRNVPDYMKLFPMLIQDWRNRWNDQKLPFIYAQLAAFEKHTPGKRLTMEYLNSLSPMDSPGYAPVREVQAAVLQISYTGMGVAIDIGDHSDVHPARKQELGFRLAKEAMRVAYGSKEVTSGPMMDTVKTEGDKIRITFTNIGSGLMMKGEKLNCFAVAGEDKQFVWADAVIENDTVVVFSDKIKNPCHVRYAWAGFPIDPNLYNKEGFPAIPFRTDTPDYLLKK